MFCTVGVYLQYLFSCKHISNFFAKVAKRDTGYNMHFIGGLPPMKYIDRRITVTNPLLRVSDRYLIEVIGY